MINEIRRAIINKLAELCPSVTRRYLDDVPQNFKPAAFMLSVYEQDHNKRLNTKYKSIVSFDLAYFSDKGAADIKSDCIAMQEILLRGFDLVGTYRALNKQARITDNVLHLLFDIEYSEMISITDPLMQTKHTKTNL